MSDIMNVASVQRSYLGMPSPPETQVAHLSTYVVREGETVPVQMLGVVRDGQIRPCTATLV